MSDRSISADFPFESRYLQVAGSRLHYIEEGTGDPVLFLHGNPTWSYLWRNIVPHASAGSRAIAIDLIGMGKSDKPDIEYRFFDHVEYVEGFIERLGLSDITLVLHDWGSALGLHYASRHEDNVKGLALMEPILAPFLSWSDFPQEFVETFKVFRSPEIGWDLIVNQNVFVEQILPAAIVRRLSDEEMERYREPFERLEARKPVWRWPNEIPIEGEPADVDAALAEVSLWLQRSDLPKLLFHAAPGAILPPERVEWCRANLANLETVDLGRGIHFLQEDHPERIGVELARWIADR